MAQAGKIITDGQAGRSLVLAKNASQIPLRTYRFTNEGPGVFVVDGNSIAKGQSRDVIGTNFEFMAFNGVGCTVTYELIA